MKRSVLLFVFTAIMFNILLLNNCVFREKEKPMNIIYIVSDCLRYDHIGKNGYHREITPFLDYIAQKGTFIKNTYAHSSWTLPSMVSHLTGVNSIASYKLAHAVSAELSFISEILSEQGYMTYMVSANPLLTEKWNIPQRFDVYEYIHSSDGIIVNQKIEELVQEKIEEPFFLYIHYMDPHSPYFPPEEFLKKVNPAAVSRSINVPNLAQHNLAPEELQAVIDSYDAEILYQDYLISQVFEILNDTYDNDFIYLITADHGDELGDHGGTGHGVTLYNEVIKVPLFFYGPGIINEGDVINQPVQVIDIVPTILDINNIVYDEDEYEGSSIFTNKSDDFESFAAVWKTTQPAGSIISNEWKYIHYFEDDNHELYNLKKDPGERQNLIDIYPEISIRLENRLQEYLQLNIDKYDHPEPVEPLKKGPDEDIEERIRALGYIG